MSQCPICNTQLRVIEQHWDGMTRFKTRRCDTERNGCGFIENVSKDYTTVTRSKGSLRTIVTKQNPVRLGRVHAGVAGCTEATPCTCDGVKERPNYLTEQEWIKKCEDCGNHRPIRTDG